MTIAESSAALAAFLTCAQAASVGLAGWRLAAGRGPAPRVAEPEGVTLVRTLRGVESHSVATLAASLRLTHPRHEVIFCVADANDPIIPLVERAMREHPATDARLLIGDDQIGVNPKLNNMVKGWRAAKYENVCFADSNLLVPPDYLERVTARWTPGTGAVSAPPIGSEAEDFWGEVECAFLNTFEARWQYAVDAIGFGFCQGKTLFTRKSILGERGLAALADEPAEDAALTRVVRRQGLVVRLATPAFPQPVGARTARGVWARQVRWARLRRATFPFYYALEILVGVVPAALALALAASAAGWPVLPCLAALVVVWYGLEAALAAVAGWPLNLAQVASWALRDALLPALWFVAWAGNDFTWHGARLKVADGPREARVG